MPGATAEAKGVRRVSPEQVKKSMILVLIRPRDGEPAIQVENTPVSLEELRATLQRLVADTKKTLLLIDAVKDVEYGVVMAVIDAARGAGITRTSMVNQPASK
jgi:biopolymer transport protein ExbD